MTNTKQSAVINNNQALEEIATQMAADLDARGEQRMGLFAVVREMKRRLDETGEQNDDNIIR